MTLDRAPAQLAPVQLASALAALAAGAALAGAYIAEHGFGLRPCELCYWQRYGHWAALGLALVGLAVAGRARKPLALLAGLGLVASGVVAGFHVGVEEGWWQGTAACGGGALDFSRSAEDLTAQLLNEPPVRCDEPAWTLFGVSMAGYNLVYSLGAGLLVWALALRSGAPSR